VLVMIPSLNLGNRNTGGSRLQAMAIERSVTKLTETDLPTAFGTFQLAVFEVEGSASNLVALTRGRIAGDVPTLVRLHSECLTGDTFGSLRCDCGEQLALSLSALGQTAAGVLLYLRQEGRGIGLVNKIRAYALQDGGLDTVDANLELGLPADTREYGSAASVLRHLGIRVVRLLTNNPEKQRGLEQHGLQIAERIPLMAAARPENFGYLQTKMTRMGHLLTLDSQNGHPATGETARSHDSQ
jgi:GTP cyclohydrolase II